MIETGEHRGQGLGGAARELTGALIGQVAKAIDGLVDELEGLGAQLFGVVERVGNRAQRKPRLARDVADFYLCHSGPFDAFQVQGQIAHPKPTKKGQVYFGRFIWGNAVASATTTKGAGTFAVVWTGWTCVIEWYLKVEIPPLVYQLAFA